MTSYYNEIDLKCCNVLRAQMAGGLLPIGFIDERSIEEVQPNDVETYTECHFFAGIGGFPLGFARANLANINVWTGGFPCQDLSVAGKRKGLAGKRSGLWFEFHRLITSVYPEWIVIENVPGLLNSCQGRDFAIILGGLTGIIPQVPTNGWGNAGAARGPIYSVAWRILDAQFYGVAQRRRRVFIVGCLRNKTRAAEILFEPESLCWDSAPSRETGAEVANTITSSAASGHKGQDDHKRGHLIVQHALSGHNQRNDPDGEHFVVMKNHGGNKRRDRPHGGFYVREMPTTKPLDTSGLNPGCAQGGVIAFKWQQGARAGSLGISKEVAPACGTTQVSAVVFDWQSGGDVRLNISGEHTSALQASQTPAVQDRYGIRRLTVTECERLQGFPDGHTAVNGMKDTPRYRMLGNAVCVPVAKWIGERIVAVAQQSTAGKKENNNV